MIILIFSGLAGFSPGNRVINIPLKEGINPYERVWQSVCWVESKNDPKAYNPKELATGIAQIRPIRLKDYNKRIGKHYTLQQMFDPKISKEIFLFYANKFSPYEIDRVAKKWNGSGKKTKEYWAKVKKRMGSINS
jgi:hypothetical protein